MQEFQAFAKATTQYISAAQQKPGPQIMRPNNIRAIAKTPESESLSPYVSIHIQDAKPLDPSNHVFK